MRIAAVYLGVGVFRSHTGVGESQLARQFSSVVGSSGSVCKATPCIAMGKHVADKELDSMQRGKASGLRPMVIHGAAGTAGAASAAVDILTRSASITTGTSVAATTATGGVVIREGRIVTVATVIATSGITGPTRPPCPAAAAT